MFIQIDGLHYEGKKRNILKNLLIKNWWSAGSITALRYVILQKNGQQTLIEMGFLRSLHFIFPWVKLRMFLSQQQSVSLRNRDLWALGIEIVLYPFNPKSWHCSTGSPKAFASYKTPHANGPRLIHTLDMHTLKSCLFTTTSLDINNTWNGLSKTLECVTPHPPHMDGYHSHLLTLTLSAASGQSFSKVPFHKWYLDQGTEEEF